MTNDLVTIGELFELLAKATRDAVWHWDLEANTVWWNEGFTTLFGYEILTNESDPASWYDNIHPDDKERTLASIHTVIDGGGKNWSAEYRFRRADGTFATVYDRGYILHRESQAIRMVGAMQDVTERVALQQARDESEERLRFALESAQMGTWEFDPVQNVARWDERSEKLLGWVKGDLSYEDSLKNIHPDDRERVNAAVQWALNPKSGGRYNTSFRTIGADDGKLRWVRFIGQTYFTEAGVAYRFSGVAQEITAEVVAREKASLAEQQARIAIEGSGSGSFSIDIDSNEMLYSPSLARIFTGDETRGVTRDVFVEHLHPDDRSAREQAYVNAATTNTINYEARFIWSDNSVHWVKVIGQYLFNSDGKPTTLSGIALDITEQKEQKKALSESDALFRNITNASTAALWITNEDSAVTYVSQKWIEWTGAPLEKHLGNGWLHYVTASDRQRASESLLADFRAFRYHESQFRVEHINGTKRWVVCTGTPQYTADGEFSGYVGAILDISDRVEAEERLRTSEERFRNMINQAPVAIGILNGRNMRVETANLPMLEIWGKSASIIGLPLLKALPEIEDQGFMELLEHVYDSGNAHYGFETLARLHRKGKLEEAYFNFVYAPVRDDSDTISGVIVVATEVSQQVKAKIALQESEQRFRNLIEEAPVATSLFVGRDLIIDMPNEAIIKFWGKGNGVIGKPLREALPELQGQSFLEILDDIYTTGNEYSAQEARADLVVDGQLRTFYFNFTYKPLRNAAGEIYAILDMAIDVTDQVVARRAIEESELRFRTLMEAIAQMTWTNTPQGDMNFYNQRWYKYTGLDFDQSKGFGWQDVVHPDDLPITLEAYKRSLTSGSVFVVENRYRRGSDGMYRWHLNRAIPIRDEAGEITLWVGSATDIHEQKLLAANLEEQVLARTKELEASNYDLRRSNENLEKFAYIASHDLQEPLRKIQSFGDILKSQHASQLGEGVNYLERMQIAAGRMSLLIKDLLAFSRISTRQETAAPVALNNIVNEVLDDLEVAIQQAAGQVVVEELPTILGDESQLRQLFQNLLSNALKFKREGVTPYIQVHSERIAANDLPPSVRPPRSAAAYYCIRVIDNGIGFDEKYIDRIFQVFQRLHSRNEYAGTGIGLAVCEKVVANHGGTITAVSQPGQGATFLIYFPVNE
ncbi:PAS domain S-box protein [Spirosoma pollinicola]|uniref:histidine kinase n=1 Tax=Spirosoma pollinicola TaxID=2057025 RepID=A0A2K8YVB6_9BACT|nr:PAS domain S-box protein [Spirosoma pollinicola]AUD01524.1 hypothetical protein CWM47_06670 [Spirosoma pollinicola]